MRRLPSGWMILLIGACSLALVWHISSPLSPPLYDGLSLPPEPYRYLGPPPGQGHQTRPPTSAHVRVPVQVQQTKAGAAATAERPPQAELSLQTSAFVIPAGVTSTVLTVQPVPPPAQPADGTIAGNVYRITARGQNGVELPLHRGRARVWLRAPSPAGSPVIEQYVGGHWTRRPTTRFGAQVFVASVDSLGDFTLVLPHAPSPGTTGGTSNTSSLPFLLLGGLVVAVAVVSLLLVRLTRHRRDEPGRDQAEQPETDIAPEQHGPKHRDTTRSRSKRRKRR